jgi:ATP-dependent RNA helicase DDX43
LLRTSDEPSTTKIDWNAIRAQPEQNLSKFKDQPDIVKNFYNEHENVKRLTKEEVDKFRLDNFNIIVELFKKETRALSSTSKVVVEKTPEETKDFLENQIPKPVRDFHEAFHEYPGIMEQIKKQKFTKPSPVQCQMWPILMKGLDCVGIAQTGTGKTLAFLLPALIHIDGQTTPREKRLGPNVLGKMILIPNTRLTSKRIYNFFF